MPVLAFLETWQKDHSTLQSNSLQKYKQAIINVLESLDRHQPYILTKEIKVILNFHLFTRIRADPPMIVGFSVHLYSLEPFSDYRMSSEKFSGNVLRENFQDEDNGIVTPNKRTRASLYCQGFYKSMSDFLIERNENSIKNAFLFICMLGNAPTLVYVPLYYGFFESLILTGLPIVMLDGIQNIDMFRRKLWRSSIVIIDLVASKTSADVSTVIGDYLGAQLQQQLRSCLQ